MVDGSSVEKLGTIDVKDILYVGIVERVQTG